ncbi:MAG TPA: DUF1329 domain-containing protein [Thermodesulfobacteriota bacterium]|nr:DUF1329 domain-containing protein [Thermodesulfobacteriota bacterium]
MNMTSRFKVVLIALGIYIALGWYSLAAAQNIADGTVIDKSNYQSVESLLFPKFIDQITKFNVSFIYKEPVEKYLIPEYEALTKKYAGQTKLDMSTLKISGYQSGLPFCREEVDAEQDLNAKGTKIMYNAYYSYPRTMGDNFTWPGFWYVWIDGRRGVERTMYASFHRHYYKHRVLMEPESVEPNEDNLWFKSMLFAERPYDLAGFGTLSFRYDDGRFDNTWGYLPAMRRIRRMSSGSWMDSVMGMAWTYDDLQMFDAFPSWYKGYKFIGKKRLLMPAESRPDGYIQDQYPKDMIAGSPICDFKNAPYWNSVQQWFQPTDVYVVECFPPDEHSYGRRIFYIDAYDFSPYLGEIYDDRGEFWKWQETNLIRKKELGKDRFIYEPDLMWQRDVQSMKGAAGLTNAGAPHHRVHDPNFKIDFFSTDTLLNAGK